MSLGEFPSLERGGVIALHARAAAAITTADARTVPILIAADDLIARNLMRATLENAGFTVVEATDGIAAHRLCRQLRPQLLVVDAAIPGIDGYELCRALRIAPETSGMPILMTTNLDDEASITRAYDAGATNFMMKPINWIVLNHYVHYMLRSNRVIAELRQRNAALERKVVQRTTVLRRLSDALRRNREDRVDSGAAAIGLPARFGHDLRTRLTAIVGLSGMISADATGPMAPRHIEYARLIQRNGRHLLAIVSGLPDPLG